MQWWIGLSEVSCNLGLVVAGAAGLYLAWLRVTASNRQAEVQTRQANALLRDANLRDARMKGTDLRGADLTGARNLTRTQLAEAITDEATRLPGLAPV